MHCLAVLSFLAAESDDPLAVAVPPVPLALPLLSVLLGLLLPPGLLALSLPSANRLLKGWLCCVWVAITVLVMASMDSGTVSLMNSCSAGVN